MSGAFAWGVLAALSLLLRALIVIWKPVRQRTLGLVMAFGAGVLISAVAFDLVEKFLPVAAGLAAGALTFFVGDWCIDRMGVTIFASRTVDRRPGSSGQCA